MSLKTVFNLHFFLMRSSWHGKITVIFKTVFDVNFLRDNTFFWFYLIWEKSPKAAVEPCLLRLLCRVKEACTLLTLKTGSAILLKEALYSSLHQPTKDPHVKDADPVAALHEVGVYSLKPEQAELVLSLRASLSVTWMHARKKKLVWNCLYYVMTIQWHNS
jgi:hypothetical protein